MTFLVFVILAFAAYRIGRFVALDTLIEGTRDKVMMWLATRGSLWAEKLSELLGCPWCITIWTGAGVTAYWAAITEWPGWWFPLYWLAVSGAAVLIWTVVDPD